MSWGIFEKSRGLSTERLQNYLTVLNYLARARKTSKWWQKKKKKSNDGLLQKIQIQFEIIWFL